MRRENRRGASFRPWTLNPGIYLCMPRSPCWQARCMYVPRRRIRLRFADLDDRPQLHLTNHDLDERPAGDSNRQQRRSHQIKMALPHGNMELLKKNFIGRCLAIICASTRLVQTGVLREHLSDSWRLLLPSV